MNDHLTESQVEFLKEKLQSREQELRRETRQALLDAEGQHLNDLADEVHDEGDASVADLLIDTNYSLIENQARELNRVQQALGRMREGHYGECMECGGDIGFERLKAEPAATRDVEHQEKYEEDYQRGSRPSL